MEKSEKFMSMAETISENVLEDERNGIMAVCTKRVTSIIM